MLVCCYLSEVRERHAYRDFGYTSIHDYAHARFGYGQRKTRYLVSLGRKLKRLPKIREALKQGKIGWCKASRVARVASTENEAGWLDSALSLTVQQLEQKIKDGTDTAASGLHFWLTEDCRILWEQALEIYRRRAGEELQPVEAFEFMVAEVIAAWGHYLPRNPTATEGDGGNATSKEEAPSEMNETNEANEAQEGKEDEPLESEAKTGPVFPFAEAVDIDSCNEPGLFDKELTAATERAIERAREPCYDEVREFVLERDGWKCSYPGCETRSRLHVHHIEYRSHGGGNQPWNLTVVCEFHHSLLHRKRIDVKGRAPFELEWTPPKLMHEVLERRRNAPSISLGELRGGAWSLESRAAPIQK